MTRAARPLSRLGLALAGVAAVLAALVLLFFAWFPYLYAESGSASYAREHRGQEILMVIAAGALLWVGWQCLRRVMSLRVGLAVITALVVIGTLRSLAEFRTPPAGARSVGGRWYVVADGGEPPHYSLYVKRMGGYAFVEDFVAEYRVVAPDCIVFRGIGYVYGGILAMCGDRMPFRGDTLTPEAELLRQARARPKFRKGWQAHR